MLTHVAAFGVGLLIGIGCGWLAYRRYGPRAETVLTKVKEGLGQ